MPALHGTKRMLRTGAAKAAPSARPQEWAIGWLPEGFRMADESYGPIQSGGDFVDHRVYSDGLASLSIFIERGAGYSDDRLEGFVVGRCASTRSVA